MATSLDLQGVIPILATPFREDESLDPESLDRLVRFMVEAGADGSKDVYRYLRPRVSRAGGEYLVATALAPGTGWKVLVEHPVVGLRLQTTRYYVLTLALIAALIRWCLKA